MFDLNEKQPQKQHSPLSQAKYEPTVSIGMGNPVVAGTLAYFRIQRESRTIEIGNVDLDLLDRRVPWLVGFLG